MSLLCLPKCLQRYFKTSLYNTMDHLPVLCLMKNGQKIFSVTVAVTDSCILRLGFFGENSYFKEFLDNGNIQSFKI